MAVETVPDVDEQDPDFVPAAEADPSGPVSDDTGAATDEPVDLPEETGQTEAGTTEELLSAEEREALKDNPAALVKAMQRSYTQKSQQLAQARRLAEALQEDPEGVIRALAKHRGMKIADAPAAGDDKKADVLGEVTGILEQQFGADSASALAPAITKLVQHLVGQAVGPIDQFRRETIERAAYTETQSTLTAFKAKYPDFPQFDADMAKLAQKVRPGEGVTDSEYMEHLYHTVKSQRQKGQTAKDGQARTAASIKAGTPKPTGVSGTKVAQNPPRNPTFKEAAAAARAGVRFEYDD